MNRSAENLSGQSADEQRLAKQAAEWVVLLSSDEPARRQAAWRDFEAWKQADPRHAAAAERLQGVISRMQQVRGGQRPARAALAAALDHAAASSAAQARGRKLKRLVATAGIALLLGLPGWLLWRSYSPGYVLADVRTATGQWQSRVLEDGSRITLNSASAVNLRYDGQRRVLQLLQGEILVQVAKDPQRPFIVETAQGSIRALGTRFVVSSVSAGVTTLSMLESRVQVHVVTPGPAFATDPVVSAGQQVSITAQDVSAPQPLDVRTLDDAWAQHQLVLQGQSLPEVLDMLDRYHPGLISYNRSALAAMHVVAVLPLDDIGRALQLLGHSFPQLRIRYLTPYLIRVDAPGQS